MMNTVRLVSLLVLLAVIVLGTNSRRGLKFEKDIRGSILFKADMEPIQHAMTLCSWVKKINKYGRPTWFSYATPKEFYEIRITDDGVANNLFGQALSTSEYSRTYLTMGKWYHYCMSWSQRDLLTTIYLNGKFVTEKKTANKTIGAEGFVLIGNKQRSYGGGWDDYDIFGGELYKLNVFSKKLSGEEIKEMFSKGICSNVEKSYGRQRYLKWEDILLEQRTEKVSEIKISECDDYVDPDPEPSPQSKWAILRTDPYYEKVVTPELYSKLTNGCDYSILDDFMGSKIDDRLIKHLNTYHDDSQGEEKDEEGDKENEGD